MASDSMRAKEQKPGRLFALAALGSSGLISQLNNSTGVILSPLTNDVIVSGQQSAGKEDLE